MLILGHTSITLGVAMVAEALHEHHTLGTTSSRTVLQRLGDSLISLSRKVDLRLLLIGSLLPDIIDKPVGLVHMAVAHNRGTTHLRRVFSGRDRSRVKLASAWTTMQLALAIVSTKD